MPVAVVVPDDADEAVDDQDEVGDGAVRSDRAGCTGSLHQCGGDAVVQLPGSASWFGGSHRRLERSGQALVIGYGLADATQKPGQGALRIGILQAFGAHELQYFGEPLFGGGEDEGLPIREVPVHGAHADASRASDVRHLHVVAVLGEQGAGRCQDAGAVALCVGAWPAACRWC